MNKKNTSMSDLGKVLDILFYDFIMIKIFINNLISLKLSVLVTWAGLI